MTLKSYLGLFKVVDYVLDQFQSYYFIEMLLLIDMV